MWFGFITFYTYDVIGRIQGTCAYLRPLKQQASLQARNLARSPKVVGVGHRLGKVSVLAIMSSKMVGPNPLGISD